jgi:hypothetical protein
MSIEKRSKGDDKSSEHEGMAMVFIAFSTCDGEF